MAVAIAALVLVALSAAASPDPTTNHVPDARSNPYLQYMIKLHKQFNSDIPADLNEQMSSLAQDVLTQEVQNAWAELAAVYPCCERLWKDMRKNKPYNKQLHQGCGLVLRTPAFSTQAAIAAAYGHWANRDWSCWSDDAYTVIGMQRLQYKVAQQLAADWEELFGGYGPWNIPKMLDLFKVFYMQTDTARRNFTYMTLSHKLGMAFESGGALTEWEDEDAGILFPTQDRLLWALVYSLAHRGLQEIHEFSTRTYSRCRDINAWYNHNTWGLSWRGQACSAIIDGTRWWDMRLDAKAGRWFVPDNSTDADAEPEMDWTDPAVIMWVCSRAKNVVLAASLLLLCWRPDLLVFWARSTVRTPSFRAYVKHAKFQQAMVKKAKQSAASDSGANNAQSYSSYSSFMDSYRSSINTSSSGGRAHVGLRSTSHRYSISAAAGGRTQRPAWGQASEASVTQPDALQQAAANSCTFRSYLSHLVTHCWCARVRFVGASCWQLVAGRRQRV